MEAGMRQLLPSLSKIPFIMESVQAWVQELESSLDFSNITFPLLRPIISKTGRNGWSTQ